MLEIASGISQLFTMRSMDGLPTGLAVLIVDDELFIAEETSIGLQLEGCDTIIAGSAAEAFEILASRPDIGVLLTDVRMPVVDGISMAKQMLAGRGDHNALSVILMTGHADDVPPPGVTACVAKPFSMSAMVGIVMQAMTDVAAKRIRACQERPPLL
jgi:DNA-binding NtrC family response regulator